MIPSLEVSPIPQRRFTVILVWNPNPTLDVASEVATLIPGAVHRSPRQTISPGGKGTLVVSALTILGGFCRGIAPVAGPSGELFAELVRQRDLPFEFTSVQGLTRVAASVVEEHPPRASVFNGPGPRTDDSTWAAHLRRIEDLLRSGDYGWFVVAGRPPLSARPDLVAEYCSVAAGMGVRVVVDVSSPVLEPVLEVKPWLVKINRDEAGALCRAEAARGGPAQELCRLGAQNAVVTDGGNATDVVLSGTSVAVTPPSVDVLSAVGCGDCFLAGLLAALTRQEGPEASVRYATAVASAAAETLEPGRFDLTRVNSLLDPALSAEDQNG